MIGSMGRKWRKAWLTLLGAGLLGMGAAHGDWQPATQPGLATLPLDGEPRAIALAGNSRLLAIGLKEAKALALVDPDTGAVSKRRIGLGGEPIALAIKADGSRVYVLTDDSDTLTVVDVTKAEVAARWKIGAEAQALVLSGDENEIVVASRQGKLYGLNAATGKVQRSKSLDLPAGELTLGLNGLRLLVAAGGSVLNLDAGTWNEIRRTALAETVKGLAWWPQGGQLLAATQDDDGLSLLNPDTGRIERQWPLDRTPAGLTTDSAARAYASIRSEEAVYRFNLDTGSLAGRYLLDTAAESLVFDPVQQVLYLTHARGLLRLAPDATPLQQVTDLGMRLRDLAVDPVNHEAVAVADKAKAFYRIPLASRQAQTLKLDAKAYRVGVDSGLRLGLAVTYADKNWLRFIDLSGSEPSLLTDKIPLKHKIKNLAVDASRNLTVLTSEEGDLLVVDNKSRALVYQARHKAKYELVGIHAGQGMAYLLSEDDHRGRYARFDLVKQQLIEGGRLDFEPNAMAIDEALNLAVITAEKPGAAYFLDLANQQIVGSLALGKEPVAVAIQPDTHMAVVALHQDDRLVMIDLARRSLQDWSHKIKEPSRLAVSSRYNLALAVGEERDAIVYVPLPNPVPVLKGLNPVERLAGKGAFTLELQGEHFIDGAVVRFGDTEIKPEWLSHTLLQAAIPAERVANPAEIPVKVFHPTPAGGDSNAISFMVRPATPVLQSVSPTALLATGEAQVLTLSGLYFLPDPSILFGSSQLQPDQASDTQASVTLPGHLLTQPGKVPVSLFKAYGGESNRIEVPVLAVPPEITGLSPNQGGPGTLVTLSGRYFTLLGATPTVRFTGAAQDARLVSVSATELQALVPADAETGPITVTTPSGRAQSGIFSVARAQDFTLTVSPANFTLYAGSSLSLNVLLGNNGSESYAGLVKLEIKNLPSGLSARFEPPALALGRAGSLVLTASGGVAPGNYTLTVEASGAVSGGNRTRLANLSVTVQAAAGVTGVKGRFVTPEGVGIAGVIVSDQATAKETQSDAAGNFLMTGLEAGVLHLKMDATPANPLYPIWPISTTLNSGQITAFADWVINPPPADDKFKPLVQNASYDQVITDERYPGLVYTVPAGTTIIGWDGVPKSRIAIERVPVDKLAVPPAPVPIKEAYHLYWGTPMGGIPSVPLPVKLPNVTGLEPGDKTELWYFYGTPAGGIGEWRLAGSATVTADGKSVATDPGVGLPNFCGSCGLAAVKCPPLPSGDPPSPDQCNKDGNPVELFSGYEMPNFGGLKCGGLTPLEVGLSYHPVDAFQGRSGIEGAVGQGWVLDYDIVLADSNQQTESKRLLLPPNNRINFIRQADGSYAAPGDPRFDGAVLRLIDTSKRTWEIGFKDGRKWRFGMTDAVGATASFLIEMVDAQGNVTQVNRRSDRKITSIGSALRAYSLTYGADNLVSEIRDPAGRSMKFTYNTQRRMETLADAEGGVTRFSYVGDDEFPAEPLCPQGTDGLRIKSIQYPGKANPTLNYHGTSRRVLRQTAADGRETRFEYHVSGACVTNVNKPGQVCAGPECPTVDSWEAFQAGWRLYGGQVIATTVVGADGSRKSRRFNGTGMPVENQDGVGQKTTSKRDAQNRVTESADALGRITRTIYDAKGNPVLVTDPLGRRTYTEYDAVLNKPSRVVRFLEDGTEVASDITYDAKGNISSITNPERNDIRLSYNGMGQLESTTDALGNVTRLGYNAAGDLVSVTDPLGNVTHMTTDAVGRTVATTDPLTYTTRNQYNGRDQITQITDTHGGITRMGYDAAGQLMSVTDARNNVMRSYGYDVQGRLVETRDAKGQAESYSYDLTGRLASRTDRNGRSTRYAYDQAGRLIRVDHPDRSVYLGYDAAGNLSSVQDGETRIEYGYDAVDRLVREDLLGPQGVIRLEHSYDHLDRRIRRSLTHDGATQVTDYAYDKAGRLTEIRFAGKTTRYTWDAAGRPTSRVLPNGVTETYSWDAAGRLTEIAAAKADGSLIHRLAYHYDEAGRRIAKDQPALSPAETPMVAEYDAANRLTRLTLKGTGAGGIDEVFTLDYDANGNLSRKAKLDGSDATGYDWDGQNRLVRLSRSGASPVTAEFRYDPLGRRIARTVNGVTTQYVYDGAQAIAELSPAGTSHLLTGLQLDEAIARYNTTGERVYLTDALGSILARMQGEQIVTSQVFSPYGQSQATGDREGDSLGYTGREDDGTGLYYYRARYYDPLTKRFASEDPIELRGGINLYGYVDADPISKVDPTGEFGIGGFAGAAAFNFGAQFFTNLYLTNGDWQLALRCVDYGDVLISGAIGAIGPSFISNVIGGKPGPGGLTAGQNRYIYFTKSLPAGFAFKRGSPPLRPGSDCECEGLSLGNLVGAMMQ
jgi:RHS repeat-associated protein